MHNILSDMMTKRFYRSLAFAAALLSLNACVGQKDDEEDLDDNGNGPATTEEGAPGLVLDFTATWCVNCPRMHTAIEEAALERPGTVFPVSIHFHDDMATPDGEALVSRFKIQSYPSLIVNLDASSLMTATAKDLLLARLDATAKGRKAACEISMTQGEGGALEVAVTAKETSTYRLSVLLLEDGIVAPQTGGTADYVHDNVLRAVLSESVDGDKLGLLEAGQSIQRSFDAKAAIPASGKYHFLAYVIDADKDQINTVTSSSTGQ